MQKPSRHPSGRLFLKACTRAEVRRWVPVLVLWAAGSVTGLGQAPVPTLTGRVVDQAQLLSSAVAQALSDQLSQHEQQYGNQVVLLTLPSLEGESIESVSMRIAESWELGSAEADNGVLVLIAPNDREMRIEVGQGLEGTLTDVASSRIIRNVMTPRFREGDFEGGILQGVGAVVQVLEGADSEQWAGDESVGDSLGDRMGAVAVIIPFVLIFGFAGLRSPFVPRLIMFFFMLPWIGVLTFILYPSRNVIIAVLVVYSILYWAIAMSPWARKAREKLGTNKWVGSTRTSWSGSSSSGGGWSSGGGGFSGGGGSFGGGGASGRW